MLKTVVNNCRLLFLWIDNQIIEIKTEEKEEEKMLREKIAGELVNSINSYYFYSYIFI